MVDPAIASFLSQHPDYEAVAARVRETLLAHRGTPTLSIHLAVVDAAGLEVARALAAELVDHIHYMRHPNSASGTAGSCRKDGGLLSMCRMVVVAPSGEGRSVLGQVADALTLHERTVFLFDMTTGGFEPFDVNSLAGTLLDDSLPYIRGEGGVRIPSSHAVVVMVSLLDEAGGPEFYDEVEAAFAAGHAPVHRAADYVVKERMRRVLGWDDRIVHRLSLSIPVVTSDHGYVRVWSRSH